MTATRLALLVPAALILRAQDQCGSCHAGIAAAFRSTGMGRSIETPTERPEALRDTARFRHAASGSTFTIRRSGRDLTFRHEETGLTAAIAAFVGSGRHSRTPVHRKPNGRFAELPLSWYAESGGYWAMSPGFDRAGHSGMRRELSDGCVFCHAAYPEAGRALAPIGCERCHGTGSAHTAGRGPILNPARLPADRKLEICLQCHLETGSRVSPAAIRRVGRGPFSYRPGEPLGGFQIYFAAETPAAGASIPVNGAGSGLLASACFQRSGGKLGCTTCHDPHGVRRIPPDSTCANCHPRAHAERGSCVECHMPKTRTEDAVHVVMTDHRIRRHPTVGNPLAPRPEQHGEFSGPVKVLYPPAPEPDPDIRAYLGIAARDRKLLESAIRMMPAPPAQFLFELGRLDPDRAGEHFRRALASGESHDEARQALAEWLIQRGRAEEALRLIDPLPEEPLGLNIRAVALVMRGHAREAVAALERSARLDPWDPLTFLNLGIARLAGGDRDGAAREWRQALRLRPDFNEARSQLKGLGLQ